MPFDGLEFHLIDARGIARYRGVSFSRSYRSAILLSARKPVVTPAAAGLTTGYRLSSLRLGFSMRFKPATWNRLPAWNSSLRLKRVIVRSGPMECFSPFNLAPMEQRPGLAWFRLFEPVLRA